VINKEVRALLPAWAVCALAIMASRWQVDPFKDLGIPAYFIGTAGIGAWIMGHEYAYGTLASLLTLPVPRLRIWTAKLAVAAPILAALAVLGVLFVQPDHGDQNFGAALFVLPAIAALFLAPWLTMLTRNALAGAVFTFAALGGSLAAGEWIGDWLYGFTNAVDAFRVAFMWWTLGGLSAVGAVLGWRTFATLEVHDGRDADVELPFAPGRTTAAGAVAGRRPLFRLFVKELRVQQLAIVVAVLWTLAYVIVNVSGVRRPLPSHTPDVSSDVLALLQAFYSLVLPAVIGSLACAEERHLGTLDGQLLLPMRSSTQWIVKSATAFGLAVLLAVFLPLVLARAFGGQFLLAGPRNDIGAVPLIIVLVVTSISLYVSTLARSGLRALIGSIAVVYTFSLVVTKVIVSGLGWRVFQMVHALRPAHPDYGRMMAVNALVVAPLPAFALLILMVVLALPNFRYATRRPAIIAMHAAILVAGLIAYDVIMSAIMALN
jgi:ABC-type transport system involved in multi-copper enzyme maturation permease subunit